MRHRLALATLAVGLAAVGPGATAAWAHGGAGSTADTLSGVLLMADFGLMSWFLHLRRQALTPTKRKLSWLLVPAMLAAVVLAFTAGSWAPKSKPSKVRPVTPARLAVVDPRPNSTTGPNVTVKLDLIGGTISPVSSNKLSPTEGHVHLFVDNKLVSMTFGLTQDLDNLSPGPHSVRAEFVAADHAPFKNPVVAAVLFQVQG